MTKTLLSALVSFVSDVLAESKAPGLKFVLIRLLKFLLRAEAEGIFDYRLVLDPHASRRQAARFRAHDRVNAQEIALVTVLTYDFVHARPNEYRLKPNSLALGKWRKDQDGTPFTDVYLSTEQAYRLDRRGAIARLYWLC